MHIESKSRPRSRSAIPLLVVAAALAAVIGVGAPIADAAATTGSITGTVTGPGGVQVNSVGVDAWGIDVFDDGYATTAFGGTYTISGLEPGEYELHFEGTAGLIGEFHDDVLNADDATPVVVTAGGTTVIDAELALGGSITGMVTPAPGTNPDESFIGVIAVGESTPSLGFGFVEAGEPYVIEGLAPGDHLVWFMELGDEAAVDEWYDDVRTAGPATSVTVVAGATTSGIDAALDWCAAPAEFSDVALSNPFCTSIDWLIAEEITGGYDDGTFRPGARITRAAMAAFLYRLEGSPAGPFPDPGFSDVPATHPFFTAISWMATTGITGGYDDGTYRPGAPVTRGAMALFLYRHAGEPPLPGGPILPGECWFSDVCAPGPFVEAIAWLADSGIATGYDDWSFRPGAAISRQAMSSFLFGYVSGVELQERIPGGLFGGLGLTADPEAAVRDELARRARHPAG